jgi:hypothetical protein
MVMTAYAEPSLLEQLSVAIAQSLKRPALKGPMVFEQNDCVVVEMPAPRMADDEIELRLDGDYTLEISSPSHRFHARVALPSRISVADSVIYYLGGILSLTFLKADAADAADYDPAYDLVLAAS